MLFCICFVLFLNELIAYLLITTLCTFVFLNEQGRRFEIHIWSNKLFRLPQIQLTISEYIEGFSFYVSLMVFLHEQMRKKLLRKWTRSFIKNKQKSCSNTQLDKRKTCHFMIFFIILFFFVFPLHVRRRLT